MIDVLHLYVEAGVAASWIHRAAEWTTKNAVSGQSPRAAASGPQIQLSRIYRLKSDAICIDCA